MVHKQIVSVEWSSSFAQITIIKSRLRRRACGLSLVATSHRVRMPGRSGGNFSLSKIFSRGSKRREALRWQGNGHSREEDERRPHHQQQQHQQHPDNSQENAHMRIDQLEDRVEKLEMLLSAHGISPQPTQTRSLSRETGKSFQLRHAQKRRTTVTPRAFTSE